jgi:rRNA maturation RNase YbeY
MTNLTLKNLTIEPFSKDHSLMSFLMRNDHTQINIDSDDINKKIGMVMNNLGCLNQEVSILLTTDADIRKLNKQFRSIDQPTDVLSFPQNADEDPPIPGEIILGDIAVSLDTAQAQAKEHGLTFEEEIILLLIHGILHLLGYDHEISEQEEEKMRSKTRVLFNLVFPGKVLASSCNY